MSMSKSLRIPPAEEIEKRYQNAHSNLGYQTARDRALPTSGIPTDEEEVLALIEAEDNDAFIDNFIKRVRQTTPGL